jgi:ABC-type dipeptide/oligopeptide/nickel transport system permease component
MIGKRTAIEILRSAIPTRLYLLLALLAVIAAVGMNVMAYMSRSFAPEWVVRELTQYAAIFRAMPLWFLIGGALTGVASRINKAIDDARAWWGSRHASPPPDPTRFEPWHDQKCR